MILHGREMGGADRFHKVCSVQCDGSSVDFKSSPQAMAQHWTLQRYVLVEVVDKGKTWVLHQRP